MQKSVLSTGLLAILAGSVLSTSAAASPRESTSFPASIDSASNGSGGGQSPSSGVVTLNHNFVGGYIAPRIRLAGTLVSAGGGTWSADSRIFITPPGHPPFTVQPFQGTSFDSVTLAADYTVNLAGGSGYDPAGAWSFKFYEDYQDSAPGVADATWTNLVVTTDDEATPPPSTPVASVEMGTLSASPSFVTNSVTITGAGEVRWMHFVLPADVTISSGRFLDITTEGSVMEDPYLVLFATDGEPVAEDDSNGSDGNSMLTFGAGLRPAVGNGSVYNGRDGELSAGGYWLACMSTWPQGIHAPYHVIGGEGSGDVTVNVRYDVAPPVAPPTAYFNMGALPTDGSFVTHTISLDPATLKWVKFTVPAPINLVSRTFLDIDTETSIVGRTALCLYNQDGSIAAFDTYDGSFDLSQLSFGTGTRLPVYNGRLYDGRDGASLPAGEYYLAVGIPDVEVIPGWLALSSAENWGDVVVRVRTGTQPMPTPPAVYTDLGTIAPGAYTHTMPLYPTEVKWFRFELSSPFTDANQKYIDIDTEGSARDGGTAFDTYLAMYSNAGQWLVSNDDSGSGYHSQLSFGQQTPNRSPVSTNGAYPGAPYDGGDGDLAAGVYWVAAYGYPNGGGSPGPDWIVTSQSDQTGTLVLNLHAGTALPPVPPASLTDLGTLPSSGTFVTASATVTAPGQIHWSRFTLASSVSLAAHTFLDIDAETSTTSSASICLFNSSGQYIRDDDGDGTDNLGQLTFGTGIRFGPGNGLMYNGRDGEDLAAGTYYVAITQNDAVFADGWQGASSGLETGGTLVTRVRTGPYVPPPGTYVKLSDGGESTDTALVCEGSGPLQTIIGRFTPSHTDLYKIRICDRGAFMATTGNSPMFSDTRLFLFDSTGHGVTFNDDTPNTSELFSTITGANVPVDGKYFLAVCGFGRKPVDGNGDALWETQPYDVERIPDGPGAANTLASWEGNTWSDNEYFITLTGACFVTSGPQPCNAADIAGLGGTGGADGMNTVDDIVFFLAEFFAGHTATADLVGLGGAPNPPDGFVTVDDLVYFLNQFFQPCHP